jgi:hypothetical protein
MKFLIASLFLIVIVAGCTIYEDTGFFRKAITDSCVSACNSVKSTRDLSSGPCISDPIPDQTDWVCDVAHSPRQAVDNLPENQCSAYRNGQAHHFVEVDTDCNLIRAV